jgi:hypothetical protein
MALNPNDPTQPSFIWAKDFTRPIGRLCLRAQGETVRLWAEAFGSAAKIGEFWGLVHGVVRVGEDATRQLSDGLLNPVAVFRGLKRPLHNITSDADAHVYIYIMNPDATYRFPIRDRFAGGELERLQPPMESVFATYVTFQQNHIDEECGLVAQGVQPVGLVVGWEWLEASMRTPSLPYDYDSRFDAKVF